MTRIVQRHPQAEPYLDKYSADGTRHYGVAGEQETIEAGRQVKLSGLEQWQKVELVLYNERYPATMDPEDQEGYRWLAEAQFTDYEGYREDYSIHADRTLMYYTNDPDGKEHEVPYPSVDDCKNLADKLAQLELELEQRGEI